MTTIEIGAPDAETIRDMLNEHEAQSRQLRQMREADIRRRIADGERQSDVARLYGVTPSTVNKVRVAMGIPPRGACLE